jgi:type IV secretory pathway VirB10-like protein
MDIVYVVKVVLAWTGQAGDAQGATGLPGEVDNRWGNILASVGISALLSIGSRIPAGPVRQQRAGHLVSPHLRHAQ